MSKEHAYAYEAGYRDGSIHYELEHCPACKNVADLQEALEENAKLRDELADAPKCDACEAMLDCDECLRADGSHKERRRLSTENAKLFALLKHESEQTEKLRELVSDMWRFTGAACKKYPRLFDPSAQGGQMVQLNAIDAFELRMRELGIEADI